MFPSTNMSFLNGSKVFRMGGISKSLPGVLGFQSAMVIPLGTYVKARRTGVLPSPRAGAAKAGIMESSIGRAIVTPTPRSIVLRERCFPVTIILLVALLAAFGTAD